MDGCPAKSDSIPVMVFPLPILSLQNYFSICPRESATIGNVAAGGLAPYLYSWQPRDSLASPDSAITVAYPAVTTQYTLTVSDSIGCKTTELVTVSVFIPPGLLIVRDIVLCKGTGVTIGDTTLSAQAPVSYRWNPATGLSSITKAMPFATPLVTTMYHLTVTFSNGCTAQDSVIVRVDDPPVAFAGNDTTICAGATMLLNCSVKNGERRSRMIGARYTRSQIRIVLQQPHCRIQQQCSLSQCRINTVASRWIQCTLPYCRALIQS